MKKITILSLYMFSVILCIAQQKQATFLTASEGRKELKENTGNTAITPFTKSIANKKTRGGSRWYDIVDAVDKEQGGAGVIYQQNASYNIMWNDSTLKAPYSSGANTVYEGIWIKSIASFLDTDDPRYNNPASYPNEVHIGRNNSYTLDSIFFPYIYRRNAAKPNIVDTLIVSIIKSNGSGQNNDLAIRYYGPSSQTAQNHNTDTLRFLHGFLDLNTASSTAYTFLASNASNVMNIKIPLTAATANDTLQNGFCYFQIPVGMNIPPANIPAISVVFKSGDTWTPNVDTLYISGNASNPNFNYFRFVAFEETKGGFQTYVKNIWTQSSLMRNDTSGWKNWHIPSYAFSNTAYEHQWFSWKATCVSCGTVGTQALETLLENISIHPNPTHEYAHIQFATPKDINNIHIEILGIDGKAIYSSANENIKANSQYRKEINLKGIASGLYILQIKSDDGNMSRKLILQ